MTALRLAPAIKARRALVFLDGTPSAPRFARALRVSGFSVRTVEAVDAAPPELATFLEGAEPGELLVVRWPSGAAWAPSTFTRLLVEFGRTLGDSCAAALLLVVDFGWVLDAGESGGLARLNVPGDPPVAAAALTASMSAAAERPGGVPSLTGVLADALLAGGSPVTVTDLYDLARRRFEGSGLTAMLFSHGDIGEVPVSTGAAHPDPVRRRRDAARAVPPRTLLASDRWTVDDRLGHRVYAEAIAACIRHRDTQPPLTIGIKGPWGAGKTSLMRMVQALLDPHGPAAGLRLRRRTGKLTNADVLRRLRPDRRDRERSEPPVDTGWRPTVWFNPWVYQSGEQVWAGLAHEIITQVTSRLPLAERERFWLELNLARVDKEAVRRRVYWLAMTRLAPVALGLLATGLLAGGCAAASAVFPVLSGTAAAVASAGCLVSVGTGVMRVASFLAESADGAFGLLVRQPDPLGRLMPQDQGYHDQTGLLHLVHGDMRQVLDLVATERTPLVVFVDDLDRCSPGTVSQVIEAVNLFVAGEFANCVFVLAMEPDVVAAHVGLAYREHVGTLPDECTSRIGWRFLEKIVQLPLSVPQLDDEEQLPGFVRDVLGLRSRAEADRRDQVPAPRAEADGRLENAIWSLSPTIDTLDEATRNAQRTLGAGASEAARAADRIFDELYSDENAYLAIEAALPALGLTNPREVKRCLNVFRFYSFVTYRRHLAGKPRPSDECVAKLAALTVRWPHLLSALTRETHPGATVLDRLEKAALAGDGDAWARAMAEAGLAEEEALRLLLGTRPPVAALARTLL